MTTEKAKQKCEDVAIDPDEYPAYQEKDESVLKFIANLEFNLNQGMMGTLSKRQIGVVRDLIDLIRRCPPDYVLEDIKPLYDVCRKLLFCQCDDELECQDYGSVFASFDSIISTSIDKHHARVLKKRKCEKSQFDVITCWENNVHFCPLSKPYYDKTFYLNFMNADYSWRLEDGKVTKIMIAVWVNAFANKFGVENKWAWAEEVWGITDLDNAYSQRKKGDAFKNMLIEQIFND